MESLGGIGPREERKAKLYDQYGDGLVCVRNRYDDKGFHIKLVRS